MSSTNIECVHINNIGANADNWNGSDQDTQKISKLNARDPTQNCIRLKRIMASNQPNNKLKKNHAEDSEDSVRLCKRNIFEREYRWKTISNWLKTFVNKCNHSNIPLFFIVKPFLSGISLFNSHSIHCVCE